MPAESFAGSASAKQTAYQRELSLWNGEVGASTARGRKGRHRPALSRNRKRDRQRTEPAANHMSSQDPSRQEKLATRMARENLREAQQRRNQGCAASSFRSPNGSSRLDRATGNAFFVSFSPTAEVSQGLAKEPCVCQSAMSASTSDRRAVDGTSILPEDRLPRADRMPPADEAIPGCDGLRRRETLALAAKISENKSPD